jgi:hypothetical protein
MIMPNKNRTLSNSLIGMGSDLLMALEVPQTVSSLWEKARNYETIKTFERFILALDLLYTLDLIIYDEGL